MASSEKPKRCLYEVLGLSRDCSVDEIRSAYKKLALQRHPDKLVKSGLSEAEATAQFQELVNAYEVLSDPRERAWYDSHRSQILFSSSSPATGNSANSVYVPNFFSYFSNSVYSGYSDSGKGFYKVYGDVFDKIYQNELNFAKKLGLGFPKEAPVMGNLDSYYTQVTAFYNYWLAFVTLMDFCWVDQYDVMAGPNRKSRRVMEEENKKLRKKARREYNDTVRGLAEFVKKRDKRVIDMQMKRAEEVERRKEEERERKKELERQKAERAKKYEEPEWAKVEDIEDEDTEEIVDDDKKKKGDGKELYCVACGKKFKSDKQWKNHEQSKKHKEKVAELRNTFIEEDEEYEEGKTEEVGEEYEEEDEVGAEESGFLSADDEVDELMDHFNSTMEIREEGNDEAQSSEQDGLVDRDSGIGLKELQSDMRSDDDEASNLEAMVSGQKNRKNGSLDQKPKRASNKIPVEVDSNEMDFMAYNNMKGSRRNRGGRKQRGRTLEEAAQTEIAEAHVEAENNGYHDTMKEASSDSFLETQSRGKEDDESETSHKLSRQAVNKKGTAKSDSNFKSKEAPKGRKKKANTKVISNRCEKCGEEFESRNKLHRHLGDTGHATLKSR
ncbi:DNAJ protein JJJ1 homolog [Coffea eugenioides]|uniref:DNAJ protein JJJ1 homolog n=1 Tax=Coffea eugenioides TaxID=49369 RepID=UPI000F6102C8|nr:DNAJ protein JJJ1 homolog [Coffea eugenioides]